MLPDRTSASTINVQDVAASLLQVREIPRPYQAYCVTEASSRPHSPDSLIPEPLRILSARNQIETTTDPARIPQQNDANTLQSPSLTTTSRLTNLVAVSETGSKTILRSALSNCESSFGDTRSVNTNHIAQAVTPRGSHLLASGKRSMYNDALSLRMEPLANVSEFPSRVSRRRLLRTSTRRTRFEDEAPLLSNGHEQMKEVSKDLETPINAGQDDEIGTIIDSLNVPGTGVYADEALPPRVPRHNADANPERPPTTRFDNSEYRIPPPQAASIEEEVPLETLDFPQISPTLRSRDPSRSPHATDLRHYRAQFPSSEVDYTPRGLPSETHEGWAHRRTEPKDAQLRYQFGRRPSVNLDQPPPPPPHRFLNRLASDDVFLSAPATRHSPSRSTTVVPPSALLPPASHQSLHDQAGPRPPPWVSFESLEAQRRQRGEARERADAALLRSKKSSSTSLLPLYVAGDSVDNSKGPLQSEVAEYRVAVLSVYPDMELDGEAGRGGRERCCTVM